MRLERVEIVGFKSFCDKQELSFQGGVTGIVGPNGCGKSNISDAISWVLGEQSAKSLRGASMADVIFAGSQSRQPVGMAEVSLRVSGVSSGSPDESPDCVVTRRLYRNGESEYLMNGQLCRLRDIHELFMDTGLGSKAYSIIEQGKIGMILSTKPADRRALIEEAAGITKYRARRRQTALKLEAAQQNLLRVNDIVHEVEKQLESLKRQASKARRYHQVRGELQGVERILYGRRFLDISQQAKGLAERIAAEEERERAASVALETEEAQMEARRSVLYEEEARLEDARAKLSELTLSVDRHQGKSGYCKEQIGEAEARGAEARREADELQARVGPQQGERLAKRSEDERVKDELRQAEAEAQAAEAAQQAAAAAQARAEDELDAARDAQVALLGRIATLGNARENVSGSAERAATDLLKLAAEREELERERARVGSLLAEAQRRLAEANAQLDTLSAGRADAAGRGQAARERAESARGEGSALQSERDSLQGRLSSLEEIIRTHAAFDEGVRALLAAAQQEAGAGHAPLATGVVADSVETDKEHERAVEAFLGDRLQALLTQDAQQAIAGIRRLEATDAGRAVFLTLRTARPPADPNGLKAASDMEPASLGLLSRHYRVSGPHAEAIRGALPDALLVAEIGQALEIASRHSQMPIVTLRGETVRGATIEGGRAVKGLLAPRREVKEIAARVAEVDARLRGVREQESLARAQAEAAFGEARELEERCHATEKDLVAIRHDLAVAEEETRRHERKATVLDAERRQAEEERGAAAVRLAELELALSGAEAEKLAGSELFTGRQAAVGEARATSEAAQARYATALSSLAALRERALAVEAECARLEAALQDLQHRIAAARGRAEEMDRRRAELQQELAEAERLLTEALLQRDRLAGEATLVEDEVREVRNELDAREHSLKERRRERETLRDALSELTVSRARAESDLDHLARESQQAVGQGAVECARSLTDDEKLKDQSELLLLVDDLRQRIERMGPVNVLAVEQTQELEERAAFLTAQRQDLLDSVAELDSAIKKIDKTSRERFREAFEIINRHFGEIFRQLFGGGTAGLSLIDEEDLLESGIDVMAQPPGKRLQSVMLLSGGEKAMTAIALLFAIFQYKPSPFCILDEVDAPLDDANIGRFVRMLEGLKGDTQFVLITHSRKTMEIADQLYGVTMEEPGVSKLVSVRFS
ncbi:MAG: chromosome segregation protein SMC [Vicinamibacteria bacterium]